MWLWWLALLCALICLQELAALPEDNVMNKINEIARRARLVQVRPLAELSAGIAVARVCVALAGPHACRARISGSAAAPSARVLAPSSLARSGRAWQVHVHLMSYMREQVLSKWMGRKQAQEWVCSPEGMAHCFTQTQRQHALSQVSPAEQSVGRAPHEHSE